jgi:signal transduction histidine kinase
MSSPKVEAPRADKVSSEEFERFCTGITDSLHALAQPLTILRSSIAAANAPGITPERQRYYLGISKSQVERACELFDSLQQLAIAVQDLADPIPLDPEKSL